MTAEMGSVAGGDGWDLTLANTLGDLGLPSMRDKVIDHTIGDPPYDEQVDKGFATLGKRTGAKLAGGRPKQERVHRPIIDVGVMTPETISALCSQVVRVTRHWIVLFCAWEQLHLYRTAINAAGGKYFRACAWEKPDGTPQLNGQGPATWGECIVVGYAAPKIKRRWEAHGKRGLYTCGVCRGPERTEHPTQKPFSLMVEIIQDFTRDGDSVLDPYAGSGTTLLAARSLGREAIGFEMNPKWFEVASRRLRGQAATVNYHQPDLFASVSP